MNLPKHTKGLTAGAFDFVHAGHCLHFEECKKYCDFLIVALQTDPSIDRPQKRKPLMSLEERYLMLRANKWVDMVVLYQTEKDLHALEWLADVRFMGADHKGKKHHKTAKIVYTTREHNYSSTRCAKLLE